MRFHAFRTLAATAAFLVLPFASYGQTVADAISALTAGDFAKAETILAPLVEAGDAEAMRHMAQLELQGRVKDADPAHARELLQQAADAGNARAAVDLGYVLLQSGDQGDAQAARDAFATAAAAGDIEGRFMWAKLTIMASRDPEELRTAMTEVQWAASQKYGPALAMVGDLFISGTFVGKDATKAMGYYQDAYANGHKASALTVAEMYAFGDLGEIKLQAALNWYETAATDGNAKAAYAIANILYAKADATEEELARAFDYANTAALSWNEDAQLLLGRMYLDGRAVAHDATEAYKWLDLAASSAVIDAHYLRAVAADELGPEAAKAAHDEARAWFDANHATPHTHRLMGNSTHVFK